MAEVSGPGRISSCVPGLDAVLSGGLLEGGLYLLQGPPGSGKTIMASQVLYHQAALGRRTLFVTVLGESHARMMMHMRAMAFFDEALIPDRVTYISAYQALEDEGLRGLSTLIRREVQAHEVTLLVLDGMSSVDAKSGPGFEIRRFTHELQLLASLTACTILLLTTSDALTTPERTMVDGMIELRQSLHGVRSERRLLVRKLRGTAFLEGEHAFRITGDGIAVFPRLEALLAVPSRRAAPPSTRVSSGVASIDGLFGGGIPEATMTALVGPSGAGKTTLGLHFIAGAAKAEPGLLFGCFEPPERLRFKAAAIGLDLAGMETDGALELLWRPVGEHILDELAGELLAAVRRRGVRRLVIDGLAGFEQASLDPERLVRFWSALANELRALGVTTLHTLELPAPDAPGMALASGPMNVISSLAEVTVLVRFVELRSRLYRLISTLKVREGAFDPTIREFEITDAGVVVGQPFAGSTAALQERTA